MVVVVVAVVVVAAAAAVVVVVLGRGLNRYQYLNTTGLARVQVPCYQWFSGFIPLKLQG